MVSWDELFGLSTAIETSLKTSVGEEEIKACKLAILGLPFPPRTIKNQLTDTLECECRRAIELARGCRIGWAVNIGNRRSIIVGKSGDWRPLIAQFLDDLFLNTVLPKISSIYSLIELLRLGRVVDRALNKLDSLLADGNRWGSLCYLIESEKVIGIDETPFSTLLENIFQFEIERALHGHGPVELQRLFDEQQQRIIPYKRVVGLRHPELIVSTSDKKDEENRIENLVIETIQSDFGKELDVLLKPCNDEEYLTARKKKPIDELLYEPIDTARTAVVTPRVESPEIEENGQTEPVMNTEVKKSTVLRPEFNQSLLKSSFPLPPVYRIAEVQNYLHSYADELGQLTLDPNFGCEIGKMIQIVLLHSSDLTSSVCFDALDAFLNLEPEDTVCDLVSACLSGRSVEITVGPPTQPTMNVFHLLEPLSFQVPFPLIYRDAFRLIVAVEYGLHSLSRSWKLVTSWRSSQAIYRVWWTLKSHLGSLHQFIRISAVEANISLLLSELKKAENNEAQLRMHADFVDRIERDLFLKSAGKPYLEAIVELSKLAVSFRYIIQRCFAFQRDDESVLFELEPLVKDLKKTVTFLRKNIKPGIWSFIS